jgi:hypothetical protein
MTLIVVTGGRHYADRQAVWRVLGALHAKEPITLLVQGGADGADLYAAMWAVDHTVRVRTISAQWKTWRGHGAGPMRNQEMLAWVAGLSCVVADRIPCPLPCRGVVGFPGGAGTADCLRRAREMGLPTWEPLA